MRQNNSIQLFQSEQWFFILTPKFLNKLFRKFMFEVGSFQFVSLSCLSLQLQGSILHKIWDCCWCFGHWWQSLGLLSLELEYISDLSSPVHPSDKTSSDPRALDWLPTSVYLHHPCRFSLGFFIGCTLFFFTLSIKV